MTVGVNDYPWANASAACCDSWNYIRRSCVSFACWRIVNDLKLPAVRWGNASNWDEAARAAGIPVNGSPAAHSILQLNPGVHGAFAAGHVGFVLGVDSGYVHLEDYDYNAGSGPYRYNIHSVPVAGSNFIHLPLPAPSPPPPRGVEMLIVFQAQTVNPPTTALFVSNGMHYRHILSSTELGDILNNTGPVFNGGAPVHFWGPGSVGDVAAFGIPADRHTASLMGVTWP